MQTKLSLIGLSVFLTVAPLFGATNDTVWKAGVASVIITPDQPMWMAGYASRTNISQGKATDLYAKALAFDDTRGARLVIVTLDLIGVPRSLRNGLEAAVAKEHGLPREGLLMNCSHTHSGPEFRMGPGPQDWAMFGKEGIPGGKSGEEYGRDLQAKLIELVRRALADRVPAKLSYQHARCGFGMNRRTPFGTNYNNFPNPDGPVDHDVPVLRVEDADGKLRAVLFGYACHNTTLALYQFCGDYAGYAQQYFESANVGVTALFMQGCGGDQNPYPRGTFDLAQQHGRSLAMSVEAALQTRPRPLLGPLRLAYAEVDIDYDGPPTRAEFEAELKSSNQYEAQHARRFLDRLDKGEKLKEKYSFPVQIVHFGDELTLVGLAGETVVDYSLRLKRELTGPALWVAGYCNDVMGYIPSAHQFREGGYEPHSSMFFSEIHPGPWAPSLEERIISKVHALNAELLRQDR
ncbi:MAG: neutral/alkaline non-lysosomal ceramidase N-terminal domain-containing protein [Verrucomicrobiota bacterium]